MQERAGVGSDGAERKVSSKNRGEPVGLADRERKQVPPLRRRSGGCGRDDERKDRKAVAAGGMTRGNRKAAPVGMTRGKECGSW